MRVQLDVLQLPGAGVRDQRSAGSATASATVALALSSRRNANVQRRTAGQWTMPGPVGSQRPGGGAIQARATSVASRNAASKRTLCVQSRRCTAGLATGRTLRWMPERCQ